jgi:hypothetical protein
MAPREDTTRKDVQKSLEVLMTLIRIYGYTGKDDVQKTVDHWMSLVKETGSWIKVAKYKLAAFYSFHHNQVLPQKPFTEAKDRPDFLLGGGAGRWLKAQLHTLTGIEREGLLQTLKNSKKGMPRPNKAMLKKAKEEYIIDMTTKRPEDNSSKTLVDWADAEKYPAKVELEISRRTLEDQLKRTVDELFTGQKYTIKERLKFFFPSTSANYINNRQQSGAVGTILNHPTLMSGLRQFGGYLKIKREYDHNDEYDAIAPESFWDPKVIEDNEGLQKAFETLWFRILIEARNESPTVEPVSLAEALKIRMITKMPPFQQTVLRNLWRKTHSVLRRHPCFHLIGAPVTEQYMLERLGIKLEDDEEYISGDYKDATNNLKSWVSETIALQIAACLDLSKIETHLYIQSLTGHLFSNAKFQANGQLMGSVTSFPILCIANAAMSRWAIEVAECRTYTLKDAKMMVNGDDVAIRTKRNIGYRLWGRITRFGGLEESIGKTYCSREFVEINSTSFTRVPEFEIEVKGQRVSHRMTRLKLTGYVNAGLLLGMKRSQGGVSLNDQADPRSSIGTRSRELLRLCPPHLHHAAMRQYLHHHRELLTKSRLPWYMPEWLGGIGAPTGPWGQNSDLDLRIAHRILLNWKKERPISLAHEGTSWKTWQQATARLPEPVYCRSKNQYSDEYLSIVGHKCIDLLFDKDIPLSDLFEGIQAGNRVAFAIKQNAKLWSPNHSRQIHGNGVTGSNKCNLPEPLQPEELEFQSLYPNYSLSEDRIKYIKQGVIATILD